MPNLPFHPAVSDWFDSSFAAPTEAQQLAWASIQANQHTLIAAPTGSGKTLAAFLAAIDSLAREGDPFGLPDETRILYVSPLKALSNDIQKNLEAPLAGIATRLFEAGACQVAIRAEVRTGDTAAASRAAMVKRPPHILVTTPESLYILLTSSSGRRMLATVRSLIVDEIHALVGSKRGAHLALSLERLERLTPQPLLRIGLSATQSPIATVGRFLTAGAPCQIIDAGHRRQLDLAVEVPDSPLEAVLSGEAAKAFYDRIAELVREHRTTLVFVNTRRLAERLARALSERLGDDQVTSHHGSLSREQRLSAEQRLKAGQLRALVATASLELGIDIGDIDLVCQWGTPGSIAAFLQRVGRSGHHAGGLPKGRLFATSRDELVECIALVDAARRGELDQLCVPEMPLDVLAQQIVAMAACEDWSEAELFQTVRRAYPYRDLPLADFDAVVRMLAEGFDTRRGIRGAYLHRDAIHRRLRGRRDARLTAITCGGAIPDNADYRVILEPNGEFIGTVDEDFAIESMAGDIFQLGNTSWKVLRLEAGTLRVADAHQQPPTIPFWFGEAPGRTHALSSAVSRLRAELDQRLGTTAESEQAASVAYLVEQLGISAHAARQAVDYLAAAKRALGVLPTLNTLVFERFFDDAGGMQFVIHAPYGSRVNRALGLAMRKRFCRSFNFELQAAADENAVILSLGVVQSFALADAARFLNSATVRDVLIQALLTAPMFNIRWRWNAVCSLALRRFQGGRKTPPYLLRMQAEDLVSCVFPDQLACQENLTGDRDIPNHPLVRQTIHDCLTEAMDVDRLTQLIAGIEAGEVAVVCRDLPEPSPLAAEIVNSRVYTFLDDAPLEERRTRAVSLRRYADPTQTNDLGRLDAEAIARVRREAWVEVRDAEELHEALLLTGFLAENETQPAWQGLLRELMQQRRALVLPWGQQAPLWIAAERLPRFRALFPHLERDFQVQWQRLPPELTGREETPETALREILRGRLSVTGPTTCEALAQPLRLADSQVEAALYALQNDGSVLRGHFTPKALADGSEEWCDRRLLARIHRLTLDRLRREIEPVPATTFWRFLCRWQRVHPEARVQGAQALAAVTAQLEGWEAAACSWESDLLPARVVDYEPSWLDGLCVSGKLVWGRVPPAGGTASAGPVKATPIALLNRRHQARWRGQATLDPHSLSSLARKVAETLQSRGALFFDELASASGLLKTQLEQALAELVARGVGTADSFMGLRALLVPEHKKQRYHALGLWMEEAGRWTLFPAAAADAADAVDTAEFAAGVLLSRYGVVFKNLLQRETSAPAWLDVLYALRRMEARGDIRGGRFVAGQYGEQFALPEAVSGLRKLRNEPPDASWIAISACDPLNLAGILTPITKIPALPANRLLLRNGEAVAAWVGGRLECLQPIADDLLWEVQQRLCRPAATRTAAGEASASSALPGDF